MVIWIQNLCVYFCIFYLLDKTCFEKVGSLGRDSTTFRTCFMEEKFFGLTDQAIRNQHHLQTASDERRVEIVFVQKCVQDGHRQTLAVLQHNSNILWLQTGRHGSWCQTNMNDSTETYRKLEAWSKALNKFNNKKPAINCWQRTSIYPSRSIHLHSLTYTHPSTHQRHTNPLHPSTQAHPPTPTHALPQTIHPLHPPTNPPT